LVKRRALTVLLGTYPFVTSSNTGLGGVITGLAVNPRKIKYVISGSLVH
jgi:adenylosuccinate synthase